jgi:integrase/recombinase XerD
MIGPVPHIEAFLEMLSAERGAAANTIDAYRRDLGDFCEFLQRHGSSLRTAEPADVSAYSKLLPQRA